MADDAVLLDSVTESRTPESSLLDHIERIAHARSGRFTVHVRLSRLQPHNRQPHHVRIASRTFDSLLNTADAQLYIFTSGDLVLMCRDVRVDDVDYVIDKVRTLFRADPLSKPDPVSGQDNFCVWYDLEVDFDELRDAVAALDQEVAPRTSIYEDASAGRGQSTDFVGQALDPAELGKIDDRLRRVRINDIIREQPAAIIGADGTERILFTECFISIGELQQRIAPGFNLVSNLWLFQHLTETIDHRILGALSQTDIAQREYDISVNLNISTVLRSPFQSFDQTIRAGAKKVVVELQLVDVFADLEAYGYARDWLRERGYRVLVDGLNPRSIRYFDPGLFQADYVKVSWGDEFSGSNSVEDVAEMMNIVDSIGVNRVILARTDSEDAIKWALVLGIRRFQGFFIDRLVSRQMAQQGPLAGSNGVDP